MKRWGLAFLIVLLACIPIYLNRGTSQALLEDTDTAVLLKAIRVRHAPLSWFTGDWPLQNHFYRPLPTLTFEIDNALYGEHPEGYGLTNALLAIASVLLLFWFLRELTDNLVLTTLSSCLFAGWVSGWGTDFLSNLVTWWGYLCLLLCIFFWLKLLITPKTDASRGLLKHRIQFSLIGALTLIYAGSEVGGYQVTAISNLSTRMIQWLPGRTASVMAVFALLAMAAYCRYERTSASVVPKEPSPLDPPATKSTVTAKPSKAAWIWALVSVVGVGLAFASYEQAVMLPAVLLGLAAALRLRGYKVRWGWQAAFWLCLVGYLILRKELLPAGVSHYQQQQLRFGPGVMLSIMDHVFPTWDIFYSTLLTLSFGVAMLLSTPIYISTFAFVTNVVAFIEARRRFVFAFTGWFLSCIAFLPMAWLKQFEHYDFWPMGIRAVFAVTLCWVGLDLIANAASLPALQAPARPDPAPGSLPHR